MSARSRLDRLSMVAGVAVMVLVVAACAIKLRGDYAFEQRFRLEAEGVTFRGRKVDMKLHEHKFPKAKKKTRKTGTLS